MKRPFPELPPGAKCTRCHSRGTIRMPQHHAIFCPNCFMRFFKTAVGRAMKRIGLPSTTPILVAVSGGKDSLALWDVLNDLGYQTKGLHLDLGIESFSEASTEAVNRFAQARRLPWVGYSLKDALGHELREIQHLAKRETCSVCGLLKRQLLNRLTIREGFRALATGHNLDDEAGRLLGNLVRHRDQYLEKHYPLLPSTHPRLPAKLKPLYRVETVEILTYCELKDISPVLSRCPLSRGATSHFFKEALDLIESRMPGTKRDFFFTHLKRSKPYSEEQPFQSCRECGEASYADVCSVCNLLGKGKQAQETTDLGKPAHPTDP
jgi:tRNA-5-methyluridine54 2-sulfurtransferase